MVIMDREDYVQKMNAILDDKSAFTLINHDPTLANENELTRFLLVLKKDGFITSWHLPNDQGQLEYTVYLNCIKNEKTVLFDL